MKPPAFLDYFTINVYWLGLNIASCSQTAYILPVLVESLVGEARKNTTLGDMRAWGLLVAILVQAGAGLLSDRSTSRWGRRRPFIVLGTVLDIVFLTLIGLAGLHWRSYWLLFLGVMLMQFSSNIAHGALQGLIPDLVPADQRGRASGIKALFELLPIVLVGFTIARIVERDTWMAIYAVMGSLFLSMLLTLPVREEPLPQKVEVPLLPLLRGRPLREAIFELGTAPLARVILLTAIFGVMWRISRGLLDFVIASWRGGSTAQLVGVALTGLVAIVLSIILGVWWSARVGIGEGVRRHPSFVWWVINRLLYLAALSSISGFALYFLKDRLKVASAGAITGNLMIVVGAFTLLATLPSGFLADRFGRRFLVAGAGVVAGLGAVSLILASDVTMVMASGCLIGVASGAFMTVNWALGTDLVPPSEAGRYLGVSNLAGAGAGIMGAGLGGPLADFFNQQLPGLGYQMLFATYSACFLISSAVLLGVREGEVL